MQALNKVFPKHTDLQLLSKFISQSSISMCIKYKKSWQKMKTLTAYIQKSKAENFVKEKLIAGKEIVKR